MREAVHLGRLSNLSSHSGVGTQLVLASFASCFTLQSWTCLHTTYEAFRYLEVAGLYYLCSDFMPPKPSRGSFTVGLIPSAAGNYDLDRQTP